MTSQTMEFETTLADGRTVALSFTRETSWTTDRHWGADADGRRGMPVTYADEDRAVDVIAHLITGDHEQPIPVTAEMEAAIDAYLRDVPPECYHDEILW